MSANKHEVEAVINNLERTIAELSEQLLKKDKVIHALKERVKMSIQKSGDAYAIFERNIVLQGLVEQQTQNLQVATKKAEAGSKAKSDFLANMSHEIRTPLNVITGMAHLILRTDLTSQQRNYINNIQNSAQSLLGLINDILDVSKIEAGKLDLEHIEFSINTVLENLINIFGVRLEGKDIEVLFSIDPAIPKTLVGDPLRLEQILNNLCNNAIKFTEKGQIILGINIEELEGDSVMLRFSVEDTGIGISEKQAEKLFQPFSQADDSVTRKYGGTGLGLSICKHLVSMMEGGIGFESELSKGSTFYFTATFPVKEKRPQFYHGLPKIITSKKILVIDDNQISNDILINILNAHGFSPASVFSGLEAIDNIKQQITNSCAYNLIFIDYKLFDINGIDLIKKINKAYIGTEHPSIILMVTASDIEMAENITKVFGKEKLLIKPFIPSTVINLILSEYTHENIPHDLSPELRQKLLDNNIRFSRPLSALVVDDNELNIYITSKILKDMGFTISSAVNGSEAISMIRLNNFDLVFMDIQMPVMDGLEATRIIRSDDRFKDLPILAMTAHAMEYDAYKSLEAGMNEHLTKPLDPIILKQVIIQIVQDIYGPGILKFDESDGTR